MGVEGLEEAKEGRSAKKEKREDPVAAHERKTQERDEARRARSERLGHEVVEEKATKKATEAEEEKPAAKRATAAKKAS